MRKRGFKSFAAVLVVLMAFALAVASAAAASVDNEGIIPGDVGVTFVSPTTADPAFLADPLLMAKGSRWSATGLLSGMDSLSGLAVDETFTASTVHRTTDGAYQMTRAVTPGFLGVNFTVISTLTTGIQDMWSTIRAAFFTTASSALAVMSASENATATSRVTANLLQVEEVGAPWAGLVGFFGR